MGDGDCVAVIYKDAEWDEYQVELTLVGQVQPQSTYYTGDYADAERQAIVMTERKEATC